MKKQKIKQLILNKETVTGLDSNQMQDVKGGTFVHYTCIDCGGTTSCSLHIMCCPPPEKNVVNDTVVFQDK